MEPFVNESFSRRVLFMTNNVNSALFMKNRVILKNVLKIKNTLIII